MSGKDDDYSIQILNVWKSFGAREILRGVDLSVRRGETMVVIGGSGTGKSVTLKHIMGTLSPDQGRVLIDGEPVDPHNDESLGRIRRKLGVLFQSAALPTGSPSRTTSRSRCAS